MNADLYQPHVGPNTAPKHHPTTTTNGNGVAHEHPEQETLHSNPVLNLDDILMELEHGGKDLLKIAHRAPKCGQELRTEIRSHHASSKQHDQQALQLKKTACSSKQSLLSEVRTTKPLSRVLRHHDTAKHTKFSQALFQDIRAWHFNHKSGLATTPRTTTATRNKQALLSEIRCAGRTRPRQALLRQVIRFSPKDLHPVHTMCRTMVWQDVRAMHGHAYKHLPPNTKEQGGTKWMMDIHNMASRIGSGGHLAKARTVDKQSLLSQIRCKETAATLKHVRKTKSTQMLLTQLRRANIALYHWPMTVDRRALMTDIRGMHGHAYKHLPPKDKNVWLMDIHDVGTGRHRRQLLTRTKTMNKQSMFSQIRAAGYDRHHDWKRHDVLPKSISMLLSQVRLAHGHLVIKPQHKVATVNRRALMSDIRRMHGVAPKHLPLKQKNSEWLMEIHAFPRHELSRHAKTVNIQSLLSEIRTSYPEKHSVAPKSIQMLLSELRMMHGHLVLKAPRTMNRSVLLSDVRACHGHVPIHLPKNKEGWMMDIHSSRPLRHVKTISKQALFSEIRAPTSGRVLHHVTPKSIQMVLSQARMMHNRHRMRHHSTLNRSALMSDIRACHGAAPKHLPKDSWMMDIQRPHHDLHHAKTMNKQSLLSEIRTTHPLLHHVVSPPKCNHDLMMQLRLVHGIKDSPMRFRHCDPVDRKGLMTDIRATHGNAFAEVCC